jgi:CubicO group peptidase (beta-lactamase class C family)
MHARHALALFLPLLLCASQPPALAAPPEPPPPGVDELVAGAMADAQIPGLALALIRRGEVVLSRGYGVRDLRGRRPITPRTVFALGSISKPVAATVIAVLADEGRLDLDRPVRDLLPDFRLRDEWATAHLSLRDLLSHRSGLPGHDALWYFSSFDRPELVRRLRHLEPSAEPRTIYQYNSLLFMTAGHAAAQHLGLSYEELARTRLLVPLGMKRTSFSIADMQREEDHALPHRRVNGAAVPIPFLDIDVMAPSGGVNASVEDLLPFLLLHLRGGRHGGRQLLAEKTLLELARPHVSISAKPRYPELRDRAAGLGFEIATYRGRRLLSHTGWVDGFKGLALLAPEEQSAVLVLCNLENTPVVNSLAYALIDRLLGLVELPWRERGREQLRKQDEEDRTGHQNQLPQRPGTRPSHPLADYAGEYEHPGYGAIRITVRDGAQPALGMTYGRTTAPLVHLHYDVFHRAPAPFDPMGPVSVSFVGGVDGGIRALAVPLEPRLPDLVFVRRADPKR